MQNKINKEEFYKNKFSNTHPWRWYYNFFLPIHLGFYKTYWFKKYFKKNSLILDIGCGGGREYFAKHYKMIGIDISETAINNAKQIYYNAIKADAEKLPFPDNTFDCVMSMDFFGHIPQKDKNKILQQIHRVLKPKGITINYIETKRRNNILEKKYQKLYYEHFILKDGHFGLEYPSDVIKRFKKYFFILKSEGHASIISPIEDYSKRFNNEMRNLNFKIRLLTKFSQLIENHTYIRFITNCLFGIFAKTLNQSSSIDNSSGIFIVGEKR